ncbi:hypothetical protein MicloDRAFT_00064440 [Microvirga lotononidis]|uniref:Uncharacterized protein n=1 Tax=Microvirga lotononidis TaxID=864069 RepID=I4YP25_9HYPH|nr:hypothetical protein MicloDRAFT_00064440 [Microvirga lotononidis]
MNAATAPAPQPYSPSFGGCRQSADLLTMGARILRTREPGVKFLPRLPVVGEGINRPSVSQLESGSQGRLPLHETPVFIVSGEPFLPGSSALILKDAQPHSLAPGGHKPQGSFPFEVNHDVSLSHDGDIATLPWPQVSNVH